MKTIYFIFVCSVYIRELVTVTEVTPGKPQVTFLNEKYLTHWNITTRRLGRRSPYGINFDTELLSAWGNNVTAKLVLMEYLSGRYVPMIFNHEYKMCDWLNNDQLLGKMWQRQLPPKFQTCPVPKGHITIKNAHIHLENFGYIIPFTWSNYRVTVRMDVYVFDTETKERIIEFNMICTVTQTGKTKLPTPTTTGIPKVTNKD